MTSQTLTSVSAQPDRELITIYTSNFRVCGKHCSAVAISRGVPAGWKGRRYLALAPSWELVKEMDEAKFRAAYHAEVLAKLDPAAVAQELGDHAILLCWEEPGEFCHRRQVAEWLSQVAGVRVREFPGKGDPEWPYADDRRYADVKSEVEMQSKRAHIALKTWSASDAAALSTFLEANPRMMTVHILKWVKSRMALAAPGDAAASLFPILRRQQRNHMAQILPLLPARAEFPEVRV